MLEREKMGWLVWGYLGYACREMKIFLTIILFICDIFQTIIINPPVASHHTSFPYYQNDDPLTHAELCMAILTYIFMMERSSPQIPPGLSSSPSRPTLSGDSPKSRDELKHVQDNVELMRNRVQLLKFQLQREKDTISKHKSLTREVVQQKIEYNKLYSIKKKDHNAIHDEISSLRARNHSYREMHKQEMNNILKALYLVKLDDARQIKNNSLQNRKSLEKAMESRQEQQRQKRQHLQEQSEHAKKRYLEYWKHKLASVYENSQRNQEQALAVAEEKKKELQMLQLQQMNLLEEINQVRSQEMQAKKEYVAALSLNTKDVAQAVKEKQADDLVYKSSNGANAGRESAMDLGSSHSQSIRYNKEQQFFTKSPHVSLMSSNDIRIPRPKVDQSKFQIILKELKRIDQREKGNHTMSSQDE